MLRLRDIEKQKRLDEEQKIREAARKLKYEEEKLRETRGFFRINYYLWLFSLALIGP